MSRHVRCPAPARRPTVSVVVPCYNYGHYLPDAVGSALAQPGVEVEVLIVDDASTDGSAQVAAALAAGDPRVALLAHERNRGHIATYNDGLHAVQGDYCVLLSADDLLAPGALGRAVRLMEAEPSVGFVYGHPASFSGAPPRARTRVRSFTVWRGHEWIAGRAARGRNCTSSPEVVMRTSVQRAIGGYRADLPHSGDFEMWMRAAVVADVGRVNGADQAFYRVHDDSMLRTTFAGWLPDLAGRRDAFEAVLGEASAQRPPDAPRLLAAARARLAAEALRHGCRAASVAGGRETAEQFRALALELDPGARATREWARLARAVAHPRPPGPLGRLGARVLESARWHRWHWSGE